MLKLDIMPDLQKKATRKLKSNSQNSEPISDELYEKLSVGQQFLVVVAEKLAIVPQIATYDGRHFVDRATIEASFEALNA